MSPRLRHLLPPALAAFALAAPAAHASFPGINGEIAFPAGAGSIRDRSPVDLFTTAGPDTLHRLAGGAGAQGGPAWSADGRRLAYASDGALVIASGNARRRIAVGRDVAAPAWAPDGTRLVFVSRGNVFTVRSDGRGARRITSDGAGSAPVWAPNAARIAFVRAATLVTVRPDGTARRTLADRVIAADWAPDGRHLVVARRAADADQHAELWILDAAGNAERRLTAGHDDLAVRWSPDGRRVAFVRDGDVWTVAVDGTGARRLTDQGDVGAALAWQPLAQQFGAGSRRGRKRHK